MQTYSLGENSWQIAPPPPYFWSPQIIVSGSPITLHYPQRDESVALRRLSELERLPPQTCAQPRLACPEDLQLTVRLVAHLASLAASAEPEAFLQSDTWRAARRLLQLAKPLSLAPMPLVSLRQSSAILPAMTVATVVSWQGPLSNGSSFTLA